MLFQEFFPWPRHHVCLFKRKCFFPKQMCCHYFHHTRLWIMFMRIMFQITFTRDMLRILFLGLKLFWKSIPTAKWNLYTILRGFHHSSPETGLTFSYVVIRQRLNHENLFSRPTSTPPSLREAKIVRRQTPCLTEGTSAVKKKSRGLTKRILLCVFSLDVNLYQNTQKKVGTDTPDGNDTSGCWSCALVLFLYIVLYCTVRTGGTGKATKTEYETATSGKMYM